MEVLKKIFDLTDKTELKRLNQIVDMIEGLEEETQSMTDEQLKNMTNIFKERLASGQTLDNIMPAAFAVAREASKRVLGMRQYPVQLMGGIVLHEGKIAEMKTGEGKTLVGVAPVYLNALTGNGVHVITVNDYLAKRDKEIMEPIYNFLGLSVGVILYGQDPEERREQYNCDITYGTNNEFGFDYLKDNMVKNKENMVQRELNFAIVDEVDSILVDEARTPLIISSPIPQNEHMFRLANVFIKMLLPSDYTYEEKDKQIALNASGIGKAEWFFKVENLMDEKNMEIYHHINQALKADVTMHRDVDYVVKDGNVEIVDEFTGRVMEGRRFSEGLHQAIEAKENLEIKDESKTLATITYQNFFRMYNKLAGMTGTAKTEEAEFESIYKMSVVQIPTNKPVIRKDLDDRLFKGEVEKFKAIVKDIETIHITGQPILVGTASIEKSEILSYLLGLRGLKHEVLNAKNHEKEAEIVSKAGTLNSITIATNMAGRGTDISLGAGDKKQEKRVRELGGLYVIGSEKHENRRIDNQLKGRAGRQGDPGTSRFYVSLEDDLMRLFGGVKMKKVAEKLDEKAIIEDKKLTKTIETAQINLESKNFAIRKDVLQYDDVMNKQRNIIYEDRKKVLFDEDTKSIIDSMIESVVSEAYSDYSKENNIEGYVDFIKELFSLESFELDNDTTNIVEETIDAINRDYNEIENKFGLKYARDNEKMVLLHYIDEYWVEHLDAIDQLKKAIGLQAIGQKDPVKEYTVESFDMFEEMNDNIKLSTIKYLFNKQ